ncbi:MAG: RNA methyltransferase [Pseudomonadales bacterium]|nr:RNA methyltransferase [Pseudomonadales bacterium]
MPWLNRAELNKAELKEAGLKETDELFKVDHIKIVLVNTTHPGNIGATARAMKNMGLFHLALVDPLEFPSGVAVGRAASALDILENANVHATLQEAIADCGLVIGTSARSRKIPWPVLSPEECAEKIVRDSDRNRVAVVFGREDRGLTNEELQLCHYHVQIPAAEQYSSLNLAAAALLICYEIRRYALSRLGQDSQQEDDYWDIEWATGEQLEQFFEHLETVLVRLDFHNPENPRQLMQRLRRLYSRVRLDTMEMNILRGILTHMEFHLDNPQPVTGRTARRRESSNDKAIQAKQKKRRQRKDFDEAAQNKRSLDTMVEILKEAGKMGEQEENGE